MAGQQFVPQIFFGLDPMVVSTVILVVTYGRHHLGQAQPVSISRRSGMFEYLAVWSAQKANAHPRRHPAAAPDHHRRPVGDRR